MNNLPLGILAIWLVAILVMSWRQMKVPRFSNLLAGIRILLVLGFGFGVSGCKEKPPAEPPPAAQEGEKITAENAKQQFYEAIKAGDIERMKTALKIDASLTGSKENGRTPLHEAVAAGQKAVVTMLLGAKASVNVKDSTGATPLHLVASGENTELAGMLLSAKADVNAKDNNGATPLYLAAVAGQRGMVEFLITNKGDASIKAKDGLSPFQAARKAEKAEVAVLLYNQEQIAVKAKIDAEADKKKFDSQKKRAADGQSTAQFDLGMRYLRGTGVDKDDAMAREWFTKAVASGSATAARMLKEMDEKSAKGEPKDAAKEETKEEPAAEAKKK